MTRPSLEDELRDLLNELAESESVDVPPLAPVGLRRLPVTADRGRRVLLAAIAVAALAVVAGALALSRRGTTVTEPASTIGEPVEIPALLAPGTEGLTISASEPQLQQTIEEPRGTVGASDGTLYVLSLALATDDVIPGEEVEIAGFNTTITPDSSAPTQIYRTVDLGCVFLTITTAGSPATSPDLTTLIESLTIDGANVSLDLPPSWNSYGVATAVDQYMSTLLVDVDGESTTELFLVQSLATPIGYYLGGETAPILLTTTDYEQLWSVAGATTPGWNAIVGTRFGTAFQLFGKAPGDVLRSVVDTFVPADSAQALPASGEANSTDVTVGYGSLRDLGGDCSATRPVLVVTD